MDRKENTLIIALQRDNRDENKVKFNRRKVENQRKTDTGNLN